MIFVIDTNVLLAALIRDSVTRKILVESKAEFYYPELSFHEVRKHKELFLQKCGMAEEEYAELLDALLKQITLVSKERL